MFFPVPCSSCNLFEFGFYFRWRLNVWAREMMELRQSNMSSACCITEWMFSHRRKSWPSTDTKETLSFMLGTQTWTSWMKKNRGKWIQMIWNFHEGEILWVTFGCCAWHTTFEKPGAGFKLGQNGWKWWLVCFVGFSVLFITSWTWLMFLEKFTKFLNNF